ncbi:MAG: hypothetical protein KGZ64_01360 [Thermaerobacter sp.]|nr:hypothetical protein [Thermaerobacter sp.]
MDLINRYVYDVVRRLPERQRSEIDKELRGLIADMLTSRTADSTPSNDEVSVVLVALGEPAKLADNYRGSGRYLIGPTYYDQYVSLLRVLLGVVFIGLSIALATTYSFNPPQSIFAALTAYLGSLFSATVQVLAWVTGGFALAEYYSTGMPQTTTRSDWTLADLPEVPLKATLIPPHEPIVGIGFTVLFMAILNFAPEILGVGSLSNGRLTIAPLFQVEVLRQALPLINSLFALALIKEVGKIYYGQWTPRLAIGNTLLNIATIALAIVMFPPNAQIWNPNISPLLQGIPRFFVLALGVGLVIDSAFCLIKAAKLMK